MLEGKLNRTEAPAWYCAKKTDDFRVLWLSLEEASRPTCLLDELAIFYNATTGRCAALAFSCLQAPLKTILACFEQLNAVSTRRDSGCTVAHMGSGSWTGPGCIMLACFAGTGIRWAWT